MNSFSNGSKYSNPKVDELLEAAAVELDDAKRVEQWTQIQHQIVEDLPEIGIGSSPDTTIYNKRIADHTVGAEGNAGSLADAYIVA